MPEIVESPALLAPMKEGCQMVEDYGSTGLSLRQHPLAFPCEDLRRQGMVEYANLTHLREGRRLVMLYIVLAACRT